MRLFLLALVVVLVAPPVAAPPPAGRAAGSPPSFLRGCAQDSTALRLRATEAGPPGARAAYLLAHCLEQAGRRDEAAAMFDATADRYPPLARYAEFRAAALMLRGGDAPEAAARLAEVLAGGVTPALARRAALLRAEALITAGAPAEAARGLKALLPTLGLEPGRNDDLLIRGWWLLAAASETLGDRPAARRAYAMAWWAVPGDPAAPEAARRLRRLTTGSLPDPPPEARAHRGIRLLRLGERAGAITELERAVRAPLPPALAAHAWYHLGQARSRSPAAVDAFRQAGRFPHQADRARYWLGRALAMTGRSGEARRVWTQVDRDFPGSPWAARSLLALAGFIEAAQGWAAADLRLADLARRYAATRQGDDARWRRGWVRFRLGKLVEAETMFVRSAADVPASRRASASLFWAAQARRRTGGDGGALLQRVASQYPMTYYGQRARAQLGLPAPPRPSAAGAQAVTADRFGGTHDELGALGFDREAAEEADALPGAEDDPALLRFIARHRARAGEIAASVEAAVGAIEAHLYGGTSADLELWMLAYPRAHWDAVHAAAAARRIDPYLALAVIREESRFDPDAASPAGAIGLMQLLPSTAAGMARRPLSRRELRDPEVSIRYGVAYLGLAAARFGGDRVLTLAAYNAGPGRARRIARRRGNDLDLWIETIPIAETRGYVQRVLESHGIYRWLYR